MSERIATFRFRWANSVDELPSELMKVLAAVGTTQKPVREDFGWYVPFDVDGTRYDVFLGPRIDDHVADPDWLLWVEAGKGPMRWLFGRKHDAVGLPILKRIQDGLQTIEGVTDIRWHERRSFDRGDESRGTAL